MDPISAAILSAATAGAASAGPKMVEKAISDGYEFLKSLLHRKFGADSEVSQAVTDIEKHPGSEGRKVTLQEEMTKVGAGNDPELLEAAKRLLETLSQSQSVHGSYQKITGNYNAQAADGSTASVNVGYSNDK